MKKIVVANWKMYPNTLAEAEDLYRISAGAIVCPPFVYLEELSKIKSGAILGAQDIAFSDEPGQTGEVSGEMLKRLGVKYVIIGHSERRWKIGETNEVVNAKLKAALQNELGPIVCLGEIARDQNYKKFLQNQTEETFAGLTQEEVNKCLIAYEPVWAISASENSKPDTPESAAGSINIIKEILPNNIFLYGGSVTSANVKSFLDREEISGVLVGGASVDKEEFKKIMEIVSSFQ